MIHDFYFCWNGRRWSGYFNAIAHQTVIAHFEDDHIRETIGQSIVYSKTETGMVSSSVHADELEQHLDIYAAIQKGVEGKLGEPLSHYLN